MGPEDLDTLATALYVRIDDLLAQNPGWAPWRPRVGIARTGQTLVANDH